MAKAAATPAVAPLRAAAIRRPQQKRSHERFELVLDAAERVLAVHDPDAISIYTIAQEAEMSPPSLYHFFPDAHQVFRALAERYYASFTARFDEPLPAGITTWQALLDYRFDSSRQFYNANAAARKVLLGASMSAASRSRDLDVDRILAERFLDELHRLFIVPAIPDLVERATETIVINDAIWSLSVHRHGTITDESNAQARRARLAYARTYLSESLPLREPAKPRKTIRAAPKRRARSSR